MYVCMYVCVYAYISMYELLYAYINACIIRGSCLCVIRYPFTVKDPVLQFHPIVLITGGPSGPARGRDALRRGAELLHGTGAGARPGGA